MKVQVPPHLVMKDVKGKGKASSLKKRKRGDDPAHPRRGGIYQDAYSAGLSASTHRERRAVHWDAGITEDKSAQPVAGASSLTSDWYINVNTPGIMKENDGRPKKSTGPGSRTPAIRKDSLMC